MMERKMITNERTREIMEIVRGYSGVFADVYCQDVALVYVWLELADDNIGELVKDLGLFKGGSLTKEEFIEDAQDVLENIHEQLGYAYKDLRAAIGDRAEEESGG